MHVSQRRISAVERGDLTRTEVGTVPPTSRTSGISVWLSADAIQITPWRLGGRPTAQFGHV
jgi:hypothetical protein